MENKEFYLKYQENPAFMVRTHILDKISFKWVQTIDNVGDLIAAYFSRTPPNELAQFTLHLPDGVPSSALDKDCFTSTDSTCTPALRPGLKLEQLGAFGTDDSRPLVLRSLNDTITMDEYMKTAPPVATYHSRLPAPSITDVTNTTAPDHILQWMDFEDNVRRWVDKTSAIHADQKLARPAFAEMMISQETPELQSFVKLSLLDPASECCPSCDFVPWPMVDAEHLGGGKPDFAMRKDSQLAAPIEIKGKWALSGADLANDWTSNDHVKGAIIQIYTYMRQKHRKFGILSSYDYTWFCYKAVMVDTQQETIFISRGIPKCETAYFSVLCLFCLHCDY